MSRVRVLVVDDSAFARKVVREVLSRDAEIEVVGVARDGLEALEKIEELRPDVMTLDLLMPELDGLGVLRALPDPSSPRVVIVSISRAESDLAIEALQMGAVDLVSKPTPLATDRLYELSNELVRKVKNAAVARPRRPRAMVPPPPLHAQGQPSVRLVVIGTSTGGPHALTRLFAALPAGLPVPLAIALHIPAGYTASLADRLTGVGAMAVEEAREGTELVPGRAVIAPGGRHLRLRGSGEKILAVVSSEPRAALYRPSVDELFESAARTVRGGVVGVVLTGMGEDGLRGAEAIRTDGGRVLAESKESCVVYGMPRAVIEAGLATDRVPLEGIAARLVELIQSVRAA